jgi:hypothetical protein
MTGLEILALIWIMGGAKGAFGASEPHATGLKHKPEPSAPPKPSKVQKPKGRGGATILPVSMPAVAKPWPAQKPGDMPAYSEHPEAWEPYIPPPAPVVKRAAALIRTLWAKGKPGASVLEQTGSVWVTYVGFVPSKGKRGVAAYRLRAGAVPDSLAA